LNLADILILSIALGMDCLLVSFSQGLIFKKNKRLNSFMLAVTMGLFQGGMPCISYTFTDFVDHFIQPFGKWLVFLIFMCLGLKFIIEAFFEKEDELCCIGWKCLLWMGFATSIDAFAAGVSLKLTSTPLILSAWIIGLGSFLMSGFGFWVGYFFKKLPAKYLEIFGGLILIFLAVKGIIV